MIEKIRQPIEESEYELLHIDEHIVVTEHATYWADWPGAREAVLLNKETGIKELWTQNDDFAGHVIVIDDVGFEFVRSLC